MIGIALRWQGDEADVIEERGVSADEGERLHRGSGGEGRGVLGVGGTCGCEGGDLSSVHIEAKSLPALLAEPRWAAAKSTR